MNQQQKGKVQNFCGYFELYLSYSRLSRDFPLILVDCCTLFRGSLWIVLGCCRVAPCFSMSELLQIYH